MCIRDSFCINVTCDSDQIDSLKESFKYNDAILRHLIVRKDEIETEPSSLLKQTQEDGETQLEEYEASIKDNTPKEATKNIDESTSDKEVEVKEEADQSDDTSDETDNSEKNNDGDETKVETENESKEDKGTT